MASKIAPAISAPGSIKMPQGSRDTDKGKHGSGGTLAKVKGAITSPTGKSGPSGSFMPERTNAMANLTGARIGQKNPDTSAAATKKSNRKGGAAFYGEM